jgi:hypothetical protein
MTHLRCKIFATLQISKKIKIINLLKEEESALNQYADLEPVW